LFSSPATNDSGTLLSCVDQTLTLMGSRTLYHWVTHPLLDRDHILKRQEATAEFTGNPAYLQQPRNLLAGVKDVERTLSRLNCGVANARDLVNVAQQFESHSCAGGEQMGPLILPSTIHSRRARSSIRKRFIASISIGAGRSCSGIGQKSWAMSKL